MSLHRHRKIVVERDLRKVVVSSRGPIRDMKANGTAATVGHGPFYWVGPGTWSCAIGDGARLETRDAAVLLAVLAQGNPATVFRMEFIEGLAGDRKDREEDNGD